MGDVSRAVRSVLAVDALERSGDPQMDPLSPRGREAGLQRLADEFVREGELGLLLRARPDEARTLGLVDRVQERLRREVVRPLEQVERETTPDHGGDGEHPARAVTQAVEPLIDDEPHVLGDLQLSDAQIGAEVPPTVEHRTRVDEVTKHLLDKEGVPLCFGIDRGGEHRRRRVSGERAKHGADLGVGVPPERDPARMMAHQHAQCLSQGG